MKKNTFVSILAALAAAIICLWYAPVASAAPDNESTLPPGLPQEFLKKKLIAVGWDSPDPAQLLANLKQIEQTPFDGVRVMIKFTVGEQVINLRRSFDTTPWKREWFEGEIKLLQQAHSPKLTDNFLMVGPGPAADWFDDAAWAVIVEHFRIAAWVAREGGLKGLIFDPEISGGKPAFTYHRQIGKDERTYAEFAAKVRQRGRQVMEAIGEEYPDITIFTLFLLGGQTHASPFREGGTTGNLVHFYLDGDTPRASGPTTPEEVLEQIAPSEMIEGGSYNLLAAFANGWFDALKPGMTIVDGLEQTYRARTKEALTLWAHAVHSTALTLVAPENRAKYGAQVQAGFGIYLDAYVNPPGSRYFIRLPADYKGPQTGQEATKVRMQSLGDIMRHAALLTDKYVWVWGEQYRWWPTAEKRVKPETWEEVSPGMTQALRLAFTPAPQYVDKLKEARSRWDEMTRTGQIKNLAAKGDFTNLDTSALTLFTNGPGTIRIDPSVGRLAPGSLQITGAADGWGGLLIPLKNKHPDCYAIRGWLLQSGEGVPRIRVRWKTADGGYIMAQGDNIYLTPAPAKKAGNWQPFEAIVVLPGRADMELQLGVSGQKSEQDSVWFDDIEVAKIPM